jgi:hypothetical protein
MVFLGVEPGSVRVVLAEGLCDLGGKQQVVRVIFKNPVRTAKKTAHFTITKFDWLVLLKEIIAVRGESYAKQTNIK